ncbi:MAG: nucleotidyl transferase AbiEii/AbiGii toxin family protein [Verrucomicrobiae bacterium]|nr:nucleotidyl transferase AbiEii/AbiGii toxin family protein [Verrucomicrobiae bacterium]
MAGKRVDYTADAVEAAKSVLIELTHILGEYRDNMVLVGGWIPDLLLPESEEQHVGSIDVDLALNHEQMTELGYRMIGEILSEHGYQQDTKQPFIFRKEVRGQVVQVDFLAGEYGGTGKSRRTQEALDMRPRKARGCDLAFQIQPAKVAIKGKLPDGAADEVQVQVASVVPFLAMKGMALNDRRKTKDAYDIYFVLKNYPGGVDAVVEAFRPYVKLGLVHEGLRKIAAKFASPDHVGPKDVAEFDETLDEEGRTMRQRDAFERVNYLLKHLGVI